MIWTLKSAATTGTSRHKKCFATWCAFISLLKSEFVLIVKKKRKRNRKWHKFCEIERDWASGKKLIFWTKLSEQFSWNGIIFAGKFKISTEKMQNFWEKKPKLLEKTDLLQLYLKPLKKYNKNSKFQSVVYSGAMRTYSTNSPSCKSFRPLYLCHRISWTWIWFDLQICAPFFSGQIMISLHFKFQSLRHPGVDIGVILYVTFIALLNVYLYCYFGDATTATFAKYPQYFFESKWYALPVNIQKYYIILLGNSHKPLIYHRLISLNLETFLKVCILFIHFPKSKCISLDFFRYSRRLRRTIWSFGLLCSNSLGMHSITAV